MVVDDVQDHLEPGLVQVRHHLLEFGEGEIGVRGVAPRRREEADGVVAPVVLESLVEQVAVVDEGVDRQQLDGRDAQRRQVIGDFRARHAGIGAAQGLGHRGMPPREALHVRLVDDGIFPRRAAARGAPPGEGRIDDAGLEVERGAVALVEGEVVVRFDLIAEQRGIPLQLTDHLPGIGVEQELVGIEAMAGRRLVGTMNAIAVDRARPRIGKVAVPDFVGVFRQHDALDLAFAGGIEQAKLDLCRVGREQCEIDAQPVPGRTERVGQAFGESRATDGGSAGEGGVQGVTHGQGLTS